MKEFDKIIGYGDVKRELEQIADVLRNPEVYRALGVTQPHGLLLYGEPGVGKTLMAKSLIEASALPAFICRKDKPNGSFVDFIRETFSQAEKAAPSIVFLDDLDKFSNPENDRRDTEEYVTVQSCVDAVKGKGVFALATVNAIGHLPRSLLRAGRFDRKIEIGPPVGHESEQVVRHFLSYKNLAADFDWESVTKLLEGVSCAEIETIANEAGMYAGFDRAEQIATNHFVRAYMSVRLEVPSGNEENPSCDPLEGTSEHRQVVYHEAGHAVISEVLRPGSVTLASCYRKSFGGAMGVTSHRRKGADEDGMTFAKADLLTALGGRAAIDQNFGQLDLGSRWDTEKACEIANRLVSDHAMSSFAFLSGRYPSSENLSARQEYAVAVLMEESYQKAKEILAANRDFFEAIAAALLEKPYLIYSDVQEIKSQFAIKTVGI